MSTKICPHDLDARALKKRLEDRDVIIGVLRDRCQKLEEALRFYADPKTHEINDANGYYPDATFPIHDDNGDRARAAIEVLPPVKP